MGNEISSREAAELIGVDKSTLTRMVQSGRLKAAREIANVRLFDRDYIELFAATYKRSPRGRKSTRARSAA